MKFINASSGCDSMLPYMLDSLPCAANNVCSCNQERLVEQKDFGYTGHLAHGSWYVCLIGNPFKYETQSYK